MGTAGWDRGYSSSIAVLAAAGFLSRRGSSAEPVRKRAPSCEALVGRRRRWTAPTSPLHSSGPVGCGRLPSWQSTRAIPARAGDSFWARAIVRRRHLSPGCPRSLRRPYGGAVVKGHGLMAIVWVVMLVVVWLRFARRPGRSRGFATGGHAHIRGLAQDLCSSYLRRLKSSAPARGVGAQATNRGVLYASRDGRGRLANRNGDVWRLGWLA